MNLQSIETYIGRENKMTFALEEKIGEEEAREPSDKGHLLTPIGHVTGQKLASQGGGGFICYVPSLDHRTTKWRVLYAYILITLLNKLQQRPILLQGTLAKTFPGCY